MFSDEVLVQRVKDGTKFMDKQAKLDREICVRFRDPSAKGYTTSLGESDDMDDPWGGDIISTIPTGVSNPLTVNLYTLVAAVAINVPDFLPVLKDEQQPNQQDGDVKKDVRDIFRKIWKAQYISDRCREAFFKGLLSGVGFVYCRWDTKAQKPEVHHVNSWDVALDPTFIHMEKVRYAAVRIRKPLREVMSLYPEAFPSNEEGSPDTRKISLWIYWDGETEAVIAQDGWKVLAKEKRSGKFPLIPYKHDYDPGPSRFPLGLGVMAAGLQSEYTELTVSISNTARHGTPITVYNGKLLSKGAKDALEKADGRAMIPVNDTTIGSLPIARIAGEPLEQSVLEARNNAARAIDDITGVSPGMRGDLIPNVTATQSAAVEGKSGARQVECKARFETFVDAVADAVLYLLQEFGGPVADEDGKIANADDTEDWEALKLVSEIHVVESSTMYRDPASDQQQSMQLFQLVINTFDHFANLVMQGVSNTVPNLKRYLDDILRAFNKQNPDDYWMEMQAPQHNQDDAPLKIMGQIYQYGPQDVRRQIEQALGMQPSQTGQDVYPGNQGNGDGAEMAQIEGDKAMQKAVMDHKSKMELQQNDLEAKAAMKAMDIAHQQKISVMDKEHERQKDMAQQGHGARMAVMNAQAQERQAAINHEATMQQQSVVASNQASMQKNQLTSQEKLAKSKGSSK